MMNVGRLCTSVQARLPHEYLGYPVDSLKGMLISQALISKVNLEDTAKTTADKKQSNRRSKHASLK